MPDFSFSDDRDLQQLSAQVEDEPEEFEHWEKLVRAAEAQEGGLNRNSSPQAIAATRDTYDHFLAHFPLFFGYWKKYADLEFSIAGPEAAELVYERGVASIGTSVDLWTNYCGFKLETHHIEEVIRSLFERAAESVGLDFLAHPFWDKYIEFEERYNKQDHIFQILNRIIHVPMHQYARYFERFRALAQARDLAELASADIISQFTAVIRAERGPKQKGDKDAGVEAELRLRLDKFHLETFNQTQAETTKRWTYEAEIKRPYYHVTELDEPQLANWRKYLDFEEAEGDYTRIRFLYERCLVTAANYDEFWFRYARWMLAQGAIRSEEVRNIYQRASCVFVPITKPAIRLYYAQFEESMERPVIASDIHEAILMRLPDHLETITSLANLHRRQYGVGAAIEVLKTRVESHELSNHVRGALVAEWARLLSEIMGLPEEARKLFQSQQPWLLDCRPFWLAWFLFEAKQPTSVALQPERYKSVKAVYDDIRRRSQLGPDTIGEVTALYLAYLREHGDKEAMKEAMRVDAEVNGPISVQIALSASLAAEAQASAMMVDTSHPGQQAMKQGEALDAGAFAASGQLFPANGEAAMMT